MIKTNFINKINITVINNLHFNVILVYLISLFDFFIEASTTLPIIIHRIQKSTAGHEPFLRRKSDFYTTLARRVGLEFVSSSRFDSPVNLMSPKLRVNKQTVPPSVLTDIQISQNYYSH